MAVSIKAKCLIRSFTSDLAQIYLAWLFSWSLQSGLKIFFRSFILPVYLLFPHSLASITPFILQVTVQSLPRPLGKVKFLLSCVFQIIMNFGFKAVLIRFAPQWCFWCLSSPNTKNLRRISIWTSNKSLVRCSANIPRIHESVDFHWLSIFPCLALFSLHANLQVSQLHFNIWGYRLRD